MAYDLYFSERIKIILRQNNIRFTEKKMMGGLVFMLNSKMCIGIDIDKRTGESRLMARIGTDSYFDSLKLPGCREMNFTGKPMKGFVYIYPEGFDQDQDLEFWVRKALDFNIQDNRTTNNIRD